jgi:hypothetical protein
MSTATKFCDELIQQYDVTLWIPIHLGKERKRGARGHSVIAGWRDTRIQLNRPDDHSRTAVNVKVEPRWATPPDPFRLRFQNGTLWSDGECEFSTQTQKIVDFLNSNGRIASRDAVAEYLGVSKDACRKAIDRAYEANAIIKGKTSISLPLPGEFDSFASIS